MDVGLTFAGSTITRLDGRNWADDGFAVGQFALVSGETANRGSYWVRTVSGTVLTLLTAAPFTAETDVRGVDVVAAAVFGSQSLIENQTGLTFDGTTVVRADGMSWSTEGFAVGQILVVKNTKTSDGSYRISALSGTTMTLASLTTTALSLAQENTANATTAISVSAVVSMRNATIVFADHGITRSRGSWTTDGFAAGDRISVRGGSANAGQYLIQSISADGRTLTVTAGTGAPDTENPLVTEGIYAVRVRGLLPFDQLTVGLFDDALSGRLLSGEGGAWMDLLAKIITQAPSATLTIADGAAITAVGGLTATVTATSVLKLSSDSVWLGISYARSNPTATLTVGAATLRAGGVLSLTSAVVNTMTVETAVSAGIDSAAMNKSKTPPENQSGAIPGPSITVTIGQATSTAGTTVGAGALLEGGTVTISATVENEFEVSSEKLGRGHQVGQRRHRRRRGRLERELDRDRHRERHRPRDHVGDRQGRVGEQDQLLHGGNRDRRGSAAGVAEPVHPRGDRPHHAGPVDRIGDQPDRRSGRRHGRHQRQRRPGGDRGRREDLQPG